MANSPIKATSRPSLIQLYCRSLFQSEHEKFVYIDKQLIEKFSPATLNINEFKSQDDIDIASKIYKNHPLLGDQIKESWNSAFFKGIDMSIHHDLVTLFEKKSNRPKS